MLLKTGMSLIAMLILAWSPYFCFAKNEAKTISFWNDLFNHRAATQAETRRCEANLLKYAPFDPNWSIAVKDLGQTITTAKIYGYGSKLYGTSKLISDETKAHAAASNLKFQLTDDFSEVRITDTEKNDEKGQRLQLGEILLPEPISKMEFYATGKREGYIVLIGWTRVHYYELTGRKIKDSTEKAFFDHNPNWEMPLYPLAMSAKQFDRDTYDIKDENNNDATLSRKLTGNLVDLLKQHGAKLTSTEDIVSVANYPAQITMKLPRYREPYHAIEFLAEIDKFGRLDLDKFSDIYTTAAYALAQMKTPDFSQFFSPMVDLAFSYPLRDHKSGGVFLNTFLNVVTQVSQGTVKTKLKSTQIDPTELAELTTPDGARWTLHYQAFSRYPLAIKPVTNPPTP